MIFIESGDSTDLIKSNLEFFGAKIIVGDPRDVKGDAYHAYLLMVEDLSGVSSFCERFPGTPVIVVAPSLYVKQGAYESVFKAGADDLVAFPLDFEELSYRILAVIKRCGGVNRIDGNLIDTDGFYNVGNIRFNPKTHELITPARSVKLADKENAFLLYMINRIGEEVTMEELSEVVNAGSIDANATIQRMRSVTDAWYKLNRHLSGSNLALSKTRYNYMFKLSIVDKESIRIS